MTRCRGWRRSTRCPLTEQVEVYADIHRRLAGVLADPDSQA